jgi:hypothetical protein
VALPDTGYSFVNWTSATQIINPNNLADSANLVLSSSDTIVAHFINPSGIASASSNQLGLSIFPSVVSSIATVKFALAEASAVSIKLISTEGKVLGNILNSDTKRAAGGYSMQFDLKATPLVAGIYFVAIEAGNYRKTVKLVYAP